MIAVSFIIGDGSPTGDLVAELDALLQVAQPGDEVIVPLCPPAAQTRAGVRQAGRGHRVVMHGTAGTAAAPPPPGRVALRLFALGARPPAGGVANLVLGQARSAAIVWLPEPLPDARRLSDAARALRAALRAGSDLALSSEGAVALRRELLHRAVLPLPESGDGLERAAFFWRATLGAERPQVPHEPCPPPSVFGLPPDAPTPAAFAALFDRLDAIVTQAGGDGAARAAARDWLLQRVAMHLAEMAPDALWPYAEALAPLAMRHHATDWRAGADALPQPLRTAREAMAMLSAAPAWRVVLAWQGARRAGRAPGADTTSVIGLAQAKWRRMRDMSD